MSSMITVTDDYDTALSRLWEIVDEKGRGYTYPSLVCDYQREGAPSCLVGHYLARVGASIEDLQEFDTSSSAKMSSDVAFLAERGLIHFEHREVLDLLDRAQTHLDAGVPWGDAVDTAHEDALREMMREGTL